MDTRIMQFIMQSFSLLFKSGMKFYCYRFLQSKRLKYIKWARHYKYYRMRLRFVVANGVQMCLWAFSSANTKSVYAPLCNPDSLHYSHIPARLAWELNLPLKVACSTSGGGGGNSLSLWRPLAGIPRW